jgi:hypothetical protein
MKTFLCLLAAAALQCGCSKPATSVAPVAVVPPEQGGSFEDDSSDNNFQHRIEWFRAGADFAIRTACTNDVVGLRQIISTDRDTGADDLRRWHGRATVEFINPVGGVERTNLFYVFHEFVGTLSVLEDMDHSYQVYQEKLRRIAAGTEP